MTDAILELRGISKRFVIIGIFDPIARELNRWSKHDYG